MAIELVDQQYVILRSLCLVDIIMDVILYWLVDIHYQKNTERPRKSKSSRSWRFMLRHLLPILLYSVYMAVRCCCGASIDVMTNLIIGAFICCCLLYISVWCYDKRHKIDVCDMVTASKKRKLWKICKFFEVLAWSVAIFFVVDSLL